MCVQLQGMLVPLLDVVVDKVGQYAYHGPSAEHPAVIFSIELQERSKIITAHSKYCIQNKTDMGLAFTVTLLSLLQLSVPGTHVKLLETRCMAIPQGKDACLEL